MACSLQHAISTAVTDCEWEQTARDRFIDQDGEEVRYLNDPDILRGCAEGTIIYVTHAGTGSLSHSAYDQWMRKRQLLDATRAWPKDAPVTERVKEARKAAWEANQKAGFYARQREANQKAKQ